jgi:hypothetical protein
VEFAIDATHARIEHTSSGVVTREDGAIFVSGIEPGIDSSVDVVTDQGARVRLVALSREEAEDAWKVRLGGDDRLLLTKQDFFWNGDADTHDIWLRQCGARQFIFTIAEISRKNAVRLSSDSHGSFNARTFAPYC